MALITSLISRLRYKIGDIKLPYVFIDGDLEDELDNAVNRYNPERSFAQLESFEYEFIVVIAWINIIYLLASDHAKYYNLSISGMAIDKSQAFRNYLELAKFLEEKLNTEIEQSEADSVMSSMGRITVTELTREKLEVRRQMPYEADKPPESIKTVVATVSGTTVKLTWGIVYITDFREYKIYRSTVLGEAGTEIKSQWDNHISEYEDVDLAAGTYYYRVDVVDRSELVGEGTQVQAVVA